MRRFAREFHYSDLDRFKQCPRMVYYRTVLGLPPERVSAKALAGTAVHTVLAWAHTYEIWDPEVLVTAWQREFQRRIKKAQAAAQAITDDDLDFEDYAWMLWGYVAQPWNRHAEVLLLEQAFCFEIKPGVTRYRFAGRIDQVIQVPTELLAAEFPQFRDFPRPEVILHRDLKTGQRRGTGPFELLLNEQLSIYAYALAYGVVDVDGDQICETPLELIPDAHALYFLQDHVPYKRPPKDHPNRRGPGMYFTERPPARLHRIPRELMPTCASIRKGDFPREGAKHGLCESYCSVRQACETDLIQDLHLQPGGITHGTTKASHNSTSHERLHDDQSAGAHHPGRRDGEPGDGGSPHPPADPGPADQPV